MVAIVTDVHYRMSLALIRDLAQAGVEVVTCEKERCRNNKASPALGALSRYASRQVWLPVEGYLDALWELCQEIGLGRECRPALLPVGAATLGQVAANRERFAEVCGLCVPTPEQLDLLNSKEQVAALASDLKIPVPRSYIRQPGENLDAFLRKLPMPCVVKPVCGEKLGLTAAQRYVVAAGGEEALKAFEHFAQLAGGEDPVVQEYLPGGALGCSVLAQEGRVLASICHRRIREYPVTGGPSSCCQCVDEPALRAYAIRLVEETGYTGLAMLEFKEDQAGKPRLLEVNPRVWGTFPLTRVSGSGIPLLWFLQAWNAGNPENPSALPEPDRPKSRKMIFAASDLMAAVGCARRGSVGKALSAVADLLNPTVRDGLFEWGDPLPGLAYFRSLFAKERHR